ncbi:polysaccharide deacetylase family protein [Tissierella sp. MB52-C2]|uniref:polysaccharide deacetylase family protein n=1 Tax=Tissierella sp. MB52-C2 TaxID=3070999 RepID=UPI00280B9ED6|nr:polysaccharide deacetylase family protein [Tissierella sp. MB52-C2]WMM24116.1 polysaccharide deacetylase family protein [Tissierella sp. MB52-C2]
MNDYSIIGFIIFIILIHTILASLYFRKFSPCVKRKVSNSENIFLTFDDGPSPIYTLEILDLLKKYEIKATFFVIAKKAKEHSDIIYRMIEDGHTLGLHSNSHKNQCLRTYWQTKRDFQKSMEVFEEFNYQVRYYRAPWGLFNPFTHYYSNKFGLKTVLWSIITSDWNPRANVYRIVNKILNNVSKGDIIVLHDSNHSNNSDNGAPGNTIQALNIVLPILIERGFKFETLDKGIGNEVEVSFLSGADA